LIEVRHTSVTACGFVEFARHSRSLKTITLDFDATISPDTHFQEDNVNRVTEITIARLQELPDRMLMTQYFQKNFPRLKMLLLGDGSYSDREGGTGITFKEP
jgi:hypothetical protein